MPAFFLGILSGAIFLTWLYNRSGGSVFMVSLWHGTYNLVSGTAAAHALVAAVVSTGVILWAVIIVVGELHRGDRLATIMWSIPTERSRGIEYPHTWRRAI